MNYLLLLVNPNVNTQTHLARAIGQLPDAMNAKEPLTMVLIHNLENFTRLNIGDQDKVQLCVSVDREYQNRGYVYRIPWAMLGMVGEVTNALKAIQTAKTYDVLIIQE